MKTSLAKSLLLSLLALFISACDDRPSAIFYCEGGHSFELLAQGQGMLYQDERSREKLQRVRSTSGEKYNNAHITVFTKGKKALLIKSAVEYPNCQLQE
jgi:membrane-bound inhibitor of C-type lysozyme